MPSKTFPTELCVLSLAAAGACASVDPGPDYDAARAQIRATTGVEQVYDPRAQDETVDALDAALADGLGLEEAARLALLHNRALQAGFLGLGVARADFVQAGLLENPSLGLAFLFPDGGGRVRWTADLLWSVNELWEIPAREALAREGIEQRVLELSRLAGELVAAVQTAYLEGVAAREGLELARADLELARRSLAGVRRQVEAGAATRTDESLAESLALSAELTLQRADRARSTALRELAALLSLERDLSGVELVDALPVPEAPPWSAEALVETGLQARPDLRAADRALAVAERRAELERLRRFPELSLGVSAERPESGADTDLLVGPSAALELPLFDRNQAQVSRAEHEAAQIRREREALAAQVAQQVRAALDRAAIAARAAGFAVEELVPQAERGAALSARAYELGDTTVLALLSTQRAALEARRVGLETRLEAALARLELARVVGRPPQEVAAP